MFCHLAGRLSSTEYERWRRWRSGKVNFQDLSVQALIDKATPAVLKFCASGKHVAKVELSICKAGGSQIEYSRVVLEDVLVTKTSF